MVVTHRGTAPLRFVHSGRVFLSGQGVGEREETAHEPVSPCHVLGDSAQARGPVAARACHRVRVFARAGKQTPRTARTRDLVRSTAQQSSVQGHRHATRAQVRHLAPAGSRNDGDAWRVNGTRVHGGGDGRADITRALTDCDLCGGV